MDNKESVQKIIVFIIMLIIFILANGVLAIFIPVTWTRYVLIGVDLIFVAMVVYMITWVIKLTKK